MKNILLALLGWAQKHRIFGNFFRLISMFSFQINWVVVQKFQGISKIQNKLILSWYWLYSKFAGDRLSFWISRGWICHLDIRPPKSGQQIFVSIETKNVDGNVPNALMPTMILNRHRSLIKVVNYRKITVGIPTICMILAVNAALDAGRLFSNAGSSQHCISV